MSVTNPQPSGDSGGSPISLPLGVTVGPPRETSMTNGAGQVVQGVQFPVTFLNGGTTSVFVPYDQLQNTPYVQQLFDARINPILAITG